MAGLDTTDSSAACPICAQPIPTAAKVCHWCGAYQTPKQWVSYQASEITRLRKIQEWITVIGILALFWTIVTIAAFTYVVATAASVTRSETRLSQIGTCIELAGTNAPLPDYCR